MYIDTHCHIHDSEFYATDRQVVYENAGNSGVSAMICVGTSEASSIEAAEYARTHENVFASLGVHPHDTSNGWMAIEHILKTQRAEKIVAIGEIGLDYFYDNSPRSVQFEALQAQLQLACEHNLPVIFHVREAFDDFWPLFDNFTGLRGVLHSFTDSQRNLEHGLERGLYVGVNGISTFTKDKAQQDMYATIPLDSLLLETDAPFLAPASRRGRPNQPAFIAEIAEYHAKARHLDVAAIARVTTHNAKTLFGL